MAKGVVIGLAGGVGSGKTTVAQFFRRLGAKVISADDLAHQVLQEPKVLRKASKIWGADIIDQERRSVNRKRLANKVFTSHPDAPMGHQGGQLRRLEALIHPPVIREIRRQIASAQTGRGETYVVDAPLLFETHLDKLCDCVVFVQAPQKLRIKRASKARGWTAEELLRREHLQKTLKEKERKADYVVTNDKSLERTFRQVKKVWQEIRRASHRAVAKVAYAPELQRRSVALARLRAEARFVAQARRRHRAPIKMSRELLCSGEVRRGGAKKEE